MTQKANHTEHVEILNNKAVLSQGNLTLSQASEL